MDGDAYAVDEKVNIIDEKEALSSRHKKERKELLATIQQLKHEVKADKRRKKDTTEKIATLEAEMSSRHDEELKQREKTATEDAQDGLRNLAIKDEDAHSDKKNKLGKKQEKIRLKREKHERENAEREERIRVQEIENLKGERHKEQELLKEKLAASGLVIYEIPSDGNCLYRAVSHQLSHLSPADHMTDAMLRQKTAEYMLSHSDDFMPFLVKPNSGEPYTYEEFVSYCRDVSTTAAWGGQPELQALSIILDTPITVVQADCSDIVIGECPTKQPLTIVYHRHVYSLGEHYNSVTPAPPTPHSDDDDTTRASDTTGTTSYFQTTAKTRSRATHGFNDTN